MNSLHLRTFLWLRWRLFVNQVKRGGVVNRVILIMLAVMVLAGAAAAFVGAFLAGLFLLPTCSETVNLLIWDGLVLAFLFSWMVGLLQELQRSEALTLDKFLHLPVSLAGVFFLNYLSSFVSVTLLLFAPVFIGLALGSMFGKSVLALVQIPLVVAFIFAVTALSYQFQGWLASLMANKRRRRTIVVIVTLIFLLFTQLPTLINLLRPWDTGAHKQTAVQKEREALHQARHNQEITHEEYLRRLQEVNRKHVDDTLNRGKRLWNTVEQSAWFANTILPPGWLPLGAAASLEGNALPALLGTAGFLAVGSASLWRAYRTVLRLYTGDFTAGRALAAPAAVKTPAPTLTPTNVSSTAAFLEKTIPGLSEQAAGVTLATFRSLSRAPEAKMLLLSPIFIFVIFGGLFLRGGIDDVPPMVYPFIVIGAITLILFTMIQLMANQFGFDRSGFRIYVLSPIPRRDLLLGKNLAMAPLVLVIVLPIVILMQFVLPMRYDHLLALPAQLISMFLMYCMWANTLSILAPMPIASGSLKPASPKGLVLVTHLFFVMLLPMTLGPTMVPFGLEALLSGLGVAEGVPIALVLVLLECAAIIALYRVVLQWQGRWLEARELKILETVTTKAE